MNQEEERKRIQKEIKNESENMLRQFEDKYLYDEEDRFYEGVAEKEFLDGKYEGDLNQQNKRHGWGLFRYNNTDVYAGQWTNNKSHGDGMYFFANGDRYRGTLENEKKHGKGEYIFFRNGNRYDGNWVNDRRDGYGEFTYRLTNEKYVGKTNQVIGKKE